MATERAPLEDELRDAQAQAEAIHRRYLRLQEAVVEHTRSLPDVRQRILDVCLEEDE